MKIPYISFEFHIHYDMTRFVFGITPLSWAFQFPKLFSMGISGMGEAIGGAQNTTRIGPFLFSVVKFSE